MMSRLTKDDSWEGLDAVAVLIRILAANPEVARIKLFEPSIVPLLQERIAIPSEYADLVRQALELHDSLDVPFWEAVLLATKSMDPVPAEFLRAAAYHNPASESIQMLDTQSISEARLRERAKLVKPGRMLAVSSGVELCDGSRRHLPMLDFGALRPPSHLQLVKEVVAQLGISGVILASGRSFHFYGETLVSELGLVNFLARALLYAPLVDARWVAHQLQESACALRISANKSNGPPIAIARIVVTNPFESRQT